MIVVRDAPGRPSPWRSTIVAHRGGVRRRRPACCPGRRPWLPPCEPPASIARPRARASAARCRRRRRRPHGARPVRQSCGRPRRAGARPPPSNASCARLAAARAGCAQLVARSRASWACCASARRPGRGNTISPSDRPPSHRPATRSRRAATTRTHPGSDSAGRAPSRRTGCPGPGTGTRPIAGGGRAAPHDAVRGPGVRVRALRAGRGLGAGRGAAAPRSSASTSAQPDRRIVRGSWPAARGERRELRGGARASPAARRLRFDSAAASLPETSSSSRRRGVAGAAPSPARVYSSSTTWKLVPPKPKLLTPTPGAGARRRGTTAAPSVFR